MKKNIYILNIETTTKNCSVSLSKDGEIVSIKEVNDGNYAHAEYLNPFINEVLAEADVTFNNLSAIAISKGPGSYTGLRIGVSAAKGLCYALDIPLISVDTMSVLAHSLIVNSGLIVAIIDARRMEVYQAIFDPNYQKIKETEAIIIDNFTYKNILQETKVYFVGDAVLKCKDFIQHDNAIFHNNTFPSAKEMNQISFKKYLENDFENVAYFEPFYLKDFIAIKKL